MKNKLIAAAAILLLFIPTYIAIACYVGASDAVPDDRVVTKMDIKDTNNQVFSFDRKTTEKDKDNVDTDNIENNMISFFLSMRDSAKPETSLPDPLIGTDFFTVTYYLYDKTLNYKYYFTNDPNEAYFIDDKNGAFRISNDDASKFLTCRYAWSLYPESQSPVMTLNNNQTLNPTTLNWRYLTFINEYATAENISNAIAPVETYKLAGGVLNLNFTKQPDYVSVKIMEDGEVIFNDLYENISAVNLNEDTTVNITVDAKWYDNETLRYGGEAMYNFYADVEAQPIFYLGKTTIEPGDFIVLSGLNIPNINDIQFSSEPSIDYTPIFFEDDKFIRALVPIKFDLPELVALETNNTPNEVLNIVFKITTSGVTQNITLNVTEKNFKSQKYEISEDIAIVKRNDATVDAFSKAMSMTYLSRDPKRYWEDNKLFLEPKGTLRSGFGIYRTVSSTGDKYRHIGVDYLVSSSDDVLSMAKGKVIYVGEQVLSGKIIVVEHGWGLKSTYCHLSISNVKEGDMVEQGTILGKVGDTGFTNGISLHIGLSVFDVPVCPYPVMYDESIPMTQLAENVAE